MIDPMADIDGTSSMMMDPATTTGDNNSHQEVVDVFDIHAHRINIKKMDYIRSFMGIISGCVAGVLGLTGLYGLVCFLLLHISVNISLLYVKMNGNLHAYTREKNVWIFVIASDVQKCGMSFLLFWTLFYGLVYLF